MGKTIIRLIAEDAALKLAGACEFAESPVQGADAGLNAGTRLLSVSITANLARALQKAKGVVIDFSTIESTLDNLSRVSHAGVPIVIGTTGFNSAQLQFVRDAAIKIPVVMAPNMSVGVNTLFKIVGDVARVLQSGYDIEVFEAHHRNKADAPSGTALRLAERICEATGRKYPDDLTLRKPGVIGKRTEREIGMQVLRGGDIVGEHTVFFCGAGERIEVKHVATDRATFAAGAVRAAKWIQGQKPGLYDMQDVLGLK